LWTLALTVFARWTLALPTLAVRTLLAALPTLALRVASPASLFLWTISRLPLRL